MGRKKRALPSVVEVLGEEALTWSELLRRAKLSKRSLSLALKEGIKEGRLGKTVDGKYYLTKSGKIYNLHGEMVFHLMDAHDLAMFPIAGTFEVTSIRKVSGSTRLAAAPQITIRDVLEQVGWHIEMGQKALESFAEALGIKKLVPRDRRIRYG